MREGLFTQQNDRGKQWRTKTQYQGLQGQDPVIGLNPRLRSVITQILINTSLKDHMADKKCSDSLKIEERLDLLESDNLVILELMNKMTDKIKEMATAISDVQDRLYKTEGKIDDETRFLHDPYCCLGMRNKEV